MAQPLSPHEEIEDLAAQAANDRDGGDPREARPRPWRQPLDDVELELAGLDADRRIPGMRAHLEGCPACQGDHESLLALVAEG